MISEYDMVLFDCDGVFWKGKRMLLGGAALISYLREQGVSVGFITNNSTMSPDTIVAKLASFGITATPDEVVTSASATVEVVKEFVKKSERRVFLMGSKVLGSLLEEADITVYTPTPMGSAELDVAKIPEVDAVIVGLDLASDYTRIALTLKALLQEPEPLFIATNRDRIFPGTSGPLPGAGLFVAAFEGALHREPFLVGKPSTAIARPLINRWRGQHDGARPRVLMVGDGLETDILLGINLQKQLAPDEIASCDTCYLYEGVLTKNVDPSIKATIETRNVQTLLELLRQEYDVTE